MSARPRNNAIPIGDGHWIDFIALEGRYNEAVEIDPLLIDLLPLWQGLEQHCEAACCGFDAFNFHPDAIASATRGMNTSDLNRWLSNAIRDRAAQGGAEAHGHVDRSLRSARTDSSCSPPVMPV